MGKNATPSLLSRFFKKSKAPGTDEGTGDVGTAAFISRFDAGLEEFSKTREFSQFYKEQSAPTQAIFLCLYVRGLQLAVAREIRALIIYVDQLLNGGSLGRKRLSFPKTKIILKTHQFSFSPRVAEETAGLGFSRAENNINIDMDTKPKTGSLSQGF
jgi:hypothetical protein